MPLPIYYLSQLRAAREAARLRENDAPPPPPPSPQGEAPSVPAGVRLALGRVVPFVVALALVAGCDDGRRAEARSETSNATYTVDRLFTHDGCTVYRFADRSEYRYFVRCEGGASRTDWDVSRYDPATKTTKTERHEIPTGRIP
jgi:hypothetical protein